MEILGLSLLGLSLLYVAAWREGWLGWLAALSMAVIALVGGLALFGGAGMAAGFGAVVAGIAGEDASEVVKEAELVMVSAVIGATVGILPLAWRMWRGIVRAYVDGLARGGVR